MAENLNIDLGGSRCYQDKPENCAKYGRLYTWDVAMSVCPKGWHLPTNEEWGELLSYVESKSGCSNCAGRHLKSKNGWYESGNGLDTYGFSAISVSLAVGGVLASTIAAVPTTGLCITTARAPVPTTSIRTTCSLSVVYKIECIGFGYAQPTLIERSRNERRGDFFVY